MIRDGLSFAKLIINDFSGPHVPHESENDKVCCGPHNEKINVGLVMAAYRFIEETD